MNNIQETLFRTIETITESKLNQIKFDKTIEAIVISDGKSEAGEYSLRYQDLIFTAYASNNTSKYKKEDNVLVLVPEGDMSNRKTIISSNKKEGEGFVDIDNIIDRVGINLVDEKKDYEILLSTTSDETVSFNIKKQTMIDMYPNKKFLAIGADIYTNINTEDIEGVYGIAVDCIFIDNEGKRAPHTFEFNTFNVTGNPFQARGYKEIQIPLLKERLVEVVGARAFSKGFTAGNEKIKMKNLVVEYVDIREQDKSEYKGNIITPKGTHFRSETLYPDEKLQLIMEFKQKGDVLNTKAIDYKWFVLNGEVDSSEHPDYHPDAGLGWEWIKSNSYDEEIISGAGTSTLLVSASFVPNFSTLKCIAHYADAGVTATDMVTLVDHTDKLDVEIVSDNGVSFVNGTGFTNLICNVTQNGKPVELEMEYEWSQVKMNQEVVMLQKGSSNTVKIMASSIGSKSTYLCEINLKEQKRPIATGQMTLVNVIDGTTQGVVIVGGFRTVLYDGEGKAPDNLAKDGFQFDVYSNGEKIDTNINWTWKIPPKEKTMLTLEGAEIDKYGYQTTKNKVLNLGVVKHFDYSKNQNTIELEVEHTVNGVVNTLKEFATISITRAGQNGADGAAGSNGLDGKTYVYQITGGSPTIIYDKDGKNPSPRRLPAFELMFSVDGDNGLAKEVDSVEWEIPNKKYSILSFSGQETKVRRIITRRELNGQSTNPHIIQLVADEQYFAEKYDNIVTAKITYKGKTFRETYPISVVKNGSDGEYGLTVSVNPNNYNIEAESDGNIPEDVSVMLNFDIYRSNIKIEDYEITSVGGVPNGMTHQVEGKNSLRLTFLRGRELSDNGVIEIDLSIEGSPCKQTFTYSKTRNGESPYLLILQSTNGLVFKRGDISTVVYAIVMRGSSIVTDEIPEEAFEWEKIDKDGRLVSGWTPNYVDDQRDKIIVTPEDILERATFNCSLNL